MCKCFIVRSHPAARVAITQQADDTDDENDDDNEYEDVEDDEDQSDSALQSSSMMDMQVAAGEGSANLSMIMEQSYMDTDLNLCLSGMHSMYCISCIF